MSALTQPIIEGKQTKRSPLFKIRKSGIRITKHQVGDIQSDDNVFIMKGGELIGNVTAPQIRVEGTLHGTAVTRELIIEATGEINGDVLAAKFILNPGGIIQGRVHNLNPESPFPTAEEIKNSFTRLPKSNNGIPPALHQPDNSNHEALENIQDPSIKTEANSPDLQHKFLELVASESKRALTEGDIQTREFKTAKSQIKQLKQQLDEALAIIAERDKTIEYQAATLAKNITLNTQHHEELIMERRRLQEIRQGFKKLRIEKEETESEFAATIDKLDEYQDRINSLELFIETESQNTIELENSLKESQELTAATQFLLEELEQEKATWLKQQEEYLNTTEELRENNVRLEIEWQQTRSELEELQNLPPDDTIPVLETSLSNAQEEISLLKAVIAETEMKVAESSEKLLWYKANIKTVENNLQQTRKYSKEQKAQLAELKDKLAEKETAVEEKTAYIKDQEEQIENKSSELADLEKRFAEIQKELKHARNKITWQFNYIERTKRVKHSAREQIEHLEAQLKSARKQIPQK